MAKVKKAEPMEEQPAEVKDKHKRTRTVKPRPFAWVIDGHLMSERYPDRKAAVRAFAEGQETEACLVQVVSEKVQNLSVQVVRRRVVVG